MLDLYVLYACVHLGAAKPAVAEARTRCVEAQVYFQADQCRKALPSGGGLMEHSKRSQSWFECRETRADSWIGADATDPGTRMYKAEAGVSDESALSALLAPLSPQARAALKSGDLKRQFERAFQGPGILSFFVVDTGSKLIVYAVSHLDDFQFADMAADVSSSSEDMATEKDLDVETMAENAGVKLSYHTEMLQRTIPPPGGVEAGP